MEHLRKAGEVVMYGQRHEDAEYLLNVTGGGHNNLWKPSRKGQRQPKHQCARSLANRPAVYRRRTTDSRETLRKRAYRDKLRLGGVPHA